MRAASSLFSLTATETPRDWPERPEKRSNVQKLQDARAENFRTPRPVH